MVCQVPGQEDTGGVNRDGTGPGTNCIQMLNKTQRDCKEHHQGAMLYYILYFLILQHLPMFQGKCWLIEYMHWSELSCRHAYNQVKTRTCA